MDRVTLILASVVVAAFGPTVASAAEQPPRDKRHEVTVDRDITYVTLADDPDAYRHRLDVYRPKGKGPFPVLFFIHGGGWTMMSKDDVLGIYGHGSIARCFAERGMVVVLPNYRLSPGVKHPEHIKDVARAFDWTVKNAAKYNGDRRQLFVAGHSAGGHLAALLATDDTYLKEVGRTRADIRGVVGVSGVYRVDDLELKVDFGMLAGAFRMKLDVRPLAVAFGDDPKVLLQASPLTHVRPGLPPFLLMNAGYDLPPLTRMAKEFAAELKKNRVVVETKELPWRTHETLLFDIPHLTADREALDVIADFVERYKTRPAADKAK